jgi:hypothetical protein
MVIGTKRCATALLALLICGTFHDASAQSPPRPPLRYQAQPLPFLNSSPFLNNPNPMVAPGLTLNQYTYNVARLGQAYSNIPPWLLGYNPYPQVLNTGPFPQVTASPYIMPWASPSLGTYSNPYVGGVPGLGAGAYGAGYGAPGLATSPYGADPSLATSGYSNPYTGGWGYWESPLTGAANLVTANANYFVTLQKARLEDAHVGMAQMDLRRKIFDEIKYERMNSPNAEDIREYEKKQALRRARNDPSMVDIFSGRALNDLFDHLARQQGLGQRGPTIPLEDEIVKHINVNNGTGGNIGLLRDDGKLQWPLVLSGPDYEADRKIVDQKIAEAVAAAKFQNPIVPATLTELRAALTRLQARLDNNVAAMSPSEYIENKRYLNMLEDAFRALRDPNVGNYFNQKWAAKGNTIAALVEDVKVKGLKFAPATPGDEPYYRALYWLLIAYDAGMAQAAAAPLPMRMP